MATLRFDFLQQLGRRDTQRAGDSNDIQKADVSLTAFNGANVSPMQTTKFRKPLLRQLSAGAKLPNTGTKQLFGVMFHLGNHLNMTTMSRQTISSTRIVLGDVWQQAHHRL